MVEVSRRSVLGVGAGTIAALTVGVEQSANAATASVGSHAGPPARSHFSGALGAIFTARNGTGAHKLRLDHVEDLRPAGDRSKCFSLIFSVRGKAKTIPAGIWTLSRPGVPTHDLFISPVGDASTVCMQAVVNRAH